ncbi:MAG TPA: NADP-dependent oxidoreductase [Stellaceae bacterium]|nr:NADP-dependent oxidoreductase [Stellaceae bacterium]
MLPKTQRQVVLKSRPNGIPEAQHFEIVTGAVPEPGERSFVVKNKFLSVEPAMRGWVNAVQNYSRPVAIGEVMRAYTAGEVAASRHSAFKEGDKVMGQFGWQEYALSDGAGVRLVRETDLPLSLSLGVLGLNGRTAYFGLLDLGEPRPSDTVVVSTAAGSVGSAVGQIAKIMGCRTVGIAGGTEKVRLCRELFGYDAALDYKSERALGAAVAAACPGGVNIYYDNTSGAVSDAVLPSLAVGARVVICGTASVASWDPPPMGPRVERHLLVKRARMQGFVAFDFEHRTEEAVARLAAWVREGKLRYSEDILDGIESCPGAIAGLYRGENLGKRIIRLQA